jgi:hypothetical protein
MVAVHPITDQLKERYAYHAVEEEDDVVRTKRFSRRRPTVNYFKKLSNKFGTAKSNIVDAIQDCYNKEFTTMITK